MPLYPYCGNYPLDSYGIKRRPRETALRYDLVQPNDGNSCATIVLDFDHPIEDLDSSVPTPNIVAINALNHHAHLFYCLATPVHRNLDSSLEAMGFLEDVTRALTGRVGADPGYAGLICKNPLSDRWVVRVLREQPYTLRELSSSLGERKVPERKTGVDYGELGRNCRLFNSLRQWAYKAIRAFPADGGFDDWQILVRAEAERMNNTTNPLSPREVDSIAKSVARWVWDHLRRGFGMWNAKSREKAKKASAEKANRRALQAMRLREKGLTQAQVARVMNCDVRTVQRLLKRVIEQAEFDFDEE